MFFTQINQMMVHGIDITLAIRKKEGRLTVSIMPKSNGLKDGAQNHFVPLTVTGTPEELDMGFIPTAFRPVQKVSGLLANIVQFEQQADMAAASSKTLKEQKDKDAREAKEKKEKFDKHMKDAADFESGKKYPEALSSLQQAKSSATPQALKQVEDKITAIKAKQGQGSLFDMELAAQPQVPQQPLPDDAYRQDGQQQPTNGQPVNRHAVQNGQQPVNGQQLFHQPVQQPLLHPVDNGYPMQDGQTAHGEQPQSGIFPDTYANWQAQDYDQARKHTVPADYSTYREGEYDQYPDFPGYPTNQKSNQ